MNDNLNRQQRHFMGYNLVAFTLIFAVFSLIVYSQLRPSLYRPVEEQLRISREIMLEDDRYIDRQLSFQDEQFHEPGPAPEQEQDREHGGKFSGPRNLPMRVQAIIRDERGEVKNTRSLGRLYFDDYLADIPLPTDYDGESMTTFTVGESAYTSLGLRKEMADGETFYIQLIANMDGEKAIVDRFAGLLAVCATVFVLLSITASYFLSRTTMAPIVKSWQRQTEFVEDASHELRTPLTIIQNKLETMLTSPGATVMDKAEEIGVALSETRRLTKLTADLMTLARVDSGEVQLEKTLFHLDALITKVSEPYRELAAMQEKTLELSLEYGQTILADEGRIHQLMVILLDNALKYTAEGDRILVRTGQRDSRAVIEVKDTGIGIPEESRERVFDRFYRADKARSRESGGSGLGLSIAKWIVGSHDGAVTVHANDGGGTLFRIKLPVGEK